MAGAWKIGGSINELSPRGNGRLRFCAELRSRRASSLTSARNIRRAAHSYPIDGRHAPKNVGENSGGHGFVLGLCQARDVSRRMSITLPPRHGEIVSASVTTKADWLPPDWQITRRNHGSPCRPGPLADPR